MLPNSRTLNKCIKLAFQEDAPTGDITSQYFGNKNSIAKAKIIVKENGILSGIDVVKYCFLHADKKAIFKALKKDGAVLAAGDCIAEISAKRNALLLAERTALNFLQHLSGVATQTNLLVNILKKSNATLLDTRKTIPGLRTLEKYAVTCGGGKNHRQGLSDMILIKENHLAQLDQGRLVTQIEHLKYWKKKLKIEIEAETLTQVKFFLSLPIDIIMLDNMSLAQMKQAIALRNRINQNIKLEASGNINKNTILAVAKTGVDYISVGSITHSAPALDFSMLIEGK